MDFTRLLGFGPYVWGAYGVFALALVAELWALSTERRALERRLAEARLVAELASRERHSPRHA